MVVLQSVSKVAVLCAPSCDTHRKRKPLRNGLSPVKVQPWSAKVPSSDVHRRREHLGLPPRLVPCRVWFYAFFVRKITFKKDAPCTRDVNTKSLPAGINIVINSAEEDVGWIILEWDAADVEGGGGQPDSLKALRENGSYRLGETPC